MVMMNDTSSSLLPFSVLPRPEGGAAVAVTLLQFWTLTLPLMPIGANDKWPSLHYSQAA